MVIEELVGVRQARVRPYGVVQPGRLVSLDDVRKIEVEVAASLAATNNAYLKELSPPQPSPFVGMVPLNEGQLKGKRIRTHLEVGRIGASSGDSLVEVVGREESWFASS
jgi:hypothetical protein